MSEAIKKSWRPGILAWLILGGGVLIVIAMFFSWDIQRITIHHWIYQFDFRYWPIQLGIVFWILFVWVVVGSFFQHINRKTKTVESETKNIVICDCNNKIRSIVYLLNCCVLIILLYFVATAFYTRQEIQQWFYFSVLVPFYFEPMTMFFYDGTLTKRLIIPPLTAIIAIGFLLYLNRIFKKRGFHDNSDQ